VFQPFGGCGFHQRAGMSSGATGMALRLASARVSVAVGVRRVLCPICCRVRPGATHSEIAVARFVTRSWKFNLGRRKFTDAYAVKALLLACALIIELLEYGFLKVA
jgi:hypothetical protein